MINFSISNDNFDRQEDIYAFLSFGGFTNRYIISQQIISKKFWEFLKTEFNVKSENILFNCDLTKDVKHREERSYRYVVTLQKPYKIMFVFYDEEKIVDPALYATKDEQENKIYELMLYFQSDAYEFVEKEILPKIHEMEYIPPTNKTFFIISRGNYGYELRSANVKEFDINLEMNYGKSFVEVDKEIISKLKNEKKGLFMFHGVPGTGKTTYLRKIILDLSDDKSIIYIPSYLMYNIADPELISFISKFKNSILLLEDAEIILTNPVESRSQAVTNILNISDGLLNDFMDMQIIATLNIQKDVIDEALLREGRMMVNYKFKKLTSKQATALSKYIGINKEYDEAKTLSEVYEEKNGKQLIDLVDIDDNTKGIGFKIKKQ